MGKRTSYLRASQDEFHIQCGSWVTYPGKKKDEPNHILFSTGGDDLKGQKLALSSYNFESDLLSEPDSILALEEKTSPRSIAVHPTGDGVVVSFDSECRLLEWEDSAEGDIKSNGGFDQTLQSSIQILTKLQGVGVQTHLVFNGDGSLLACGGEEGHIRVFEWPNMKVVIDLPKAFKTLRDLDISFDSGFISAVGDNGLCRVWDLNTLEEVATLEPNQGESFGLSKFSRDRRKAFLFITITKAKRGFIGVWDMTNWTKIGTKRFLNEPICAFAISHHGKRLAIGNNSGDVSIIGIKKMEIEQTIKSAHVGRVLSLQFSPNSKAVLSVAADKSARVSAVDISKDWKEWQVTLLLVMLILVSIVPFYLLYRYGDEFFRPTTTPSVSIISEPIIITHDDL